ncbi:MAG: hypothetical protein JWL80_682 [Parcubacteria group bacterium]|nr:hypothetical protein [Parcubacteria group bacterium]
MTILERTERLPLKVPRNVLTRITQCDDPETAAKRVLDFQVEDAVSILDNLDPLTAAFIVAYFTQFRVNNGSTALRMRKYKIDRILHRGRELQIRGMNGLCFARDQIFRETGYTVA